MNINDFFNEARKYCGKNIIEEVAEDYEWDVSWGDDNIAGEKSVEFGKYSPAGEDFSFEVYYTDVSEIPDKVEEYYEGFDAEEHVMLWADSAGRNGVPRLRELIEDADAIEAMIRELAVALKGEQE